MGNWDLLERVIVLLAAALAGGILFRRLKQQPIAGYLLVGVLLGPGGIGLLRSTDQIRALSELGVSLLLFSIGLEFSFKRLREIGRVATAGGALQILATASVVAILCRQLHLSWQEAALIGIAVSMSSTAVVLRVLAERAQLDSQHGRNATGLLLLQDLAVIPLLVAIEAMATPAGKISAFLELGGKLLAAVLLVGLLVLIARYVMPRVLLSAAAAGSRELPVILAVLASLGGAWGAHSIGFSPALGAFAAGILLAESRFAEQIRADIAPFSHVFVTIFFASVGTFALVPAGWNLLRVIGAALALLLLKSLLVAVIVWLFQRSLRVAVRTGLALSQVGEFTFVLAGAGHREGILSTAHFQFLLAVSVVTLILTPYLIAAAPAFCAMVLRWMPPMRRKALEEEPPEDRRDKFIVVGYGPAGWQVVERLATAGAQVVVLDMNPHLVAADASASVVKFGDATQPEILQHVGAFRALAMVITLPDPDTVRLIIRQMKRLAPTVPLVVRSRYHLSADRLLDAGADCLVDEELIVGKRLAEEALQYVTAPAISTCDRGQDRVRR